MLWSRHRIAQDLIYGDCYIQNQLLHAYLLHHIWFESKYFCDALFSSCSHGSQESLTKFSIWMAFTTEKLPQTKRTPFLHSCLMNCDTKHYELSITIAYSLRFVLIRIKLCLGIMWSSHPQRAHDPFTVRVCSTSVAACTITSSMFFSSFIWL